MSIADDYHPLKNLVAEIYEMEWALINKDKFFTLVKPEDLDYFDWRTVAGIPDMFEVTLTTDGREFMESVESFKNL